MDLERLTQYAKDFRGLIAWAASNRRTPEAVQLMEDRAVWFGLREGVAHALVSAIRDHRRPHRIESAVLYGDVLDTDGTVIETSVTPIAFTAATCGGISIGCLD